MYNIDNDDNMHVSLGTLVRIDMKKMATKFSHFKAHLKINFNDIKQIKIRIV